MRQGDRRSDRVGGRGFDVTEMGGRDVPPPRPLGLRAVTLCLTIGNEQKNPELALRGLVLPDQKDAVLARALGGKKGPVRPANELVRTVGVPVEPGQDEITCQDGTR